MARKSRKSAKPSLLRSKRTLMLVLLLLLISVAGAVALTHKSTPSAPTPSGPSSGNINYGPPSAQEKQEAESNKQALSKGSQNNPLPTDSSGKTSVIPVISEADETGVSAYVPGIFENGGSCIAVFTQGNQSLSKTVTAFANATYTSCPPINTSASFFPSTGQWTLTVAYKSNAAEGTSAAASFKVE